MVNTVTKQTLVDGPRNLVVQVWIAGDGSGEETNTLLIDSSTFSGMKAGSTVRVDRLKSGLDGFAASLSWDATTQAPFLEIPQNYAEQTWRADGGLVNNAGSGITGDIKFSTIGLGATDRGSFTLWMIKKP